MGRVVGVSIDVPDVRHVILFKVTLQSLADADEAIFIAAGKPEEPQFLLR